MDTGQSFRKYHQTGRYKGFYMVKERFEHSTRTTFLIFSNGKKYIYSSGKYTEEAMYKAFKAIDGYRSQK